MLHLSTGETRKLYLAHAISSNKSGSDLIVLDQPYDGNIKKKNYFFTHSHFDIEPKQILKYRLRYSHEKHSSAHD